MYWVLLGDGFFLKRFKIEVESEISSGVIKILGRKNPNSFYKKAKALFYISGMDGLPNVLLEALLFKLPIIMDKYCPAVEFFNNGSVRITNFNDKFCLQDTIRLIIQDYSQFKKMSEKAYLDYRDRFSVRNVSRQLEGALSAVIKLPYE
jgi:glycosyltransferase involved in cell wall biosynthesis